MYVHRSPELKIIFIWFHKSRKTDTEQQRTTRSVSINNYIRYFFFSFSQFNAYSWHSTEKRKFRMQIMPNEFTVLFQLKKKI